MPTLFDLEKAIAAWRRPFEHNRAFSGEDVEELEGSFRDRVASLAEAGLTEEAAFREASRRMGTYRTAEEEYRKVYWGKLQQRRQLIPELSWRLSMLANYLKVAWRTVLKEKGYSFINVFSLAVGVAFCTLIFLFVRDELTYDHFHEQGDRIFRVEETTLQPDGGRRGGSPSGPVVLGPALQADVPGIADYIRFHDEPHYVRTPGASADAIEEDVLFADPAVLEVFTFPLLRGNPAVALAAPNTVVLTETMARKHFGGADPVGQTLQIRLGQAFEDFVVTGVAADVPGNSTIRFGILLPFERLFMFNDVFRDLREDWHFYHPQTFVALSSKPSTFGYELCRTPVIHHDRYGSHRHRFKDDGPAQFSDAREHKHVGMCIVVLQA
jgi:putative ABC transport system permease protein